MERSTGHTLAFLMLRLTLGVHMIFAFVGKIATDGASGTFKQPDVMSGVTQTANFIHDSNLENFRSLADSLLGAGTIGEDTISNFLYSFGMTLPWLELALGVFLLVGFLTRTTLWVLLFTYASLAFGMLFLTDMAAVQDVGKFLNFPIYLAATIAAIALAQHNRFAVVGGNAGKRAAADQSAN